MPLKPKIEKEQENEQAQSKKANRGVDLRLRMEESAEYGAQYRSEHQGADLPKIEIKHEEKLENLREREEAQQSDLLHKE
ncbi:MAG: hypothetical protein H7256_02320 [Bdellovibrio sp.]|nr:hypothetical protein [Bdellovibrio sp.]